MKVSSPPPHREWDPYQIWLCFEAKKIFFSLSIFSVFDALVPTTSALRLLPVPSAYYRCPVPTITAQYPLSLPSAYYQCLAPTTNV